MKIGTIRKPLQLSFIFHVMIILVLVTLNMSPVRSQNILVVDFTMEHEPYKRQGIDTATVAIPAESAKHLGGMRITEPILNQQNEVPKPTFSPESSDTQEHPQTTVTTVNQTDLDKQMRLSEFARFGEQSLIHEAGFQKGVPSVTSGGGKGDIISSEKSRYVKAHFSYIKDLINKHLIYPAIAKKMGWEGKVITTFVVSPEGYARDVRIYKGSGHAILDENAIKAINNASPFPKPPIEAQIIIPILYRLN